ncbi:MAG: hypothetical protein KC549_01300 [Myxococcales bacterium]|nr:hypothetical protein [Myxococcales bacterium]MCB9549468.1 hypothetical protein [Myxococcales bacterium]
MTDTLSNDPETEAGEPDLVLTDETLQQLNEQHWRRLGLSQTFDRLVVHEVAIRPAPPADVQDRISAGLGGGAAKFLALTFDKLVKDLCRRGVLQVADGGLRLHAVFDDRLRQLIEAEERGDSRVDPTPGVTLADVVRQVEEREKKAKERPARVRKPAAKAGSETPRTRKGAKTPAAEAAPAPAPAAVVEAPREATPASQLFTSRTINRLLDSLDTGPLLKDQVRERLALRPADFGRFLEVTGALELTRISRDEMIELHWRGRELVKTAAAERRIVLIDVVRQLRERAESD